MSKFPETLATMINIGELPLVIPGLGTVFGTIASIEDDEVTIALSDGSKVIMHVSNVIVSRN